MVTNFHHPFSIYMDSPVSFHLGWPAKWERRRRLRKMAGNQEGQQNQAGRHQEVGHKSLLQSDALYQVKFKSMNSHLPLFHFKLFSWDWWRVFTLFFFFCVSCSIYLRPAFIPESRSPWKSCESWRQNTPGERWDSFNLCVWIHTGLMGSIGWWF